MIRNTHTGERVEWGMESPPRSGIVVELPKRVDYDVDALTGRRPGESVAEFGRLAGVRCDDLACQCHQSAWLHSVNECQLRPVTRAFVEVPLW